MRIAFVSAMASHPWGGSEELWAGAAKYLAAAGHEVGVCVPGWKPRPAPLHELTQTGIEVHERGDVGGLRRLARHARTRWGVRVPGQFPYERWLKKFNPDFVCVSNGNFRDGLWCLEFLHESGLPYASIVQANAEFLWPKDPEADRLRAVYQAATAIYCVSKANLKLLEHQLAIALAQAEIVHNPYKVNRELPPPWPQTNGQFRLACVGRLEPDAKGQDLLFEVLANSSWADRPLQVTLFGDGNAKGGLKRLAAMYGLNHRVHFSAPVKDVSEIWKNYHGLVLPSRYEGLPLVLIEAALMSRFAIVTNVADNAEVVEDGVTGFVAAAPSADALAAAMERAWANRDGWEAMGVAARNRVLAMVPEDPCLEFSKKLLTRFSSE